MVCADHVLFSVLFFILAHQTTEMLKWLILSDYFEQFSWEVFFSAQSADILNCCKTRNFFKDFKQGAMVAMATWSMATEYCAFLLVVFYCLPSHFNGTLMNIFIDISSIRGQLMSILWQDHTQQHYCSYDRAKTISSLAYLSSQPFKKLDLRLTVLYQ